MRTPRQTNSAAQSSGPETVPPALVRGGTLWTACQSATEKELRLTLPAIPGVYRLSAVARDAHGALAENEVLLDTRDGLHCGPMRRPGAASAIAS